MDRLGTRRGFAIAIVLWSVAAISHAWAATVAGFMAARFALGLGEAGAFPASIKTVAEWFPGRERALATGLFNAGTNVGALITPLAIPWITAQFGWPGAFIATGALGFFWLAIWLVWYRAPDSHPRLSEAERAHIYSDREATLTRVPWGTLVAYRQTWAFAIAKFLTDPIWWLYLFWMPDFFSRVHGLSLAELGPPLVTIYIAADVGSVGGGWLSSSLMRRGWTANGARKLAMLVCALSVVPIVAASEVRNLWAAVALISVAAAAHQGWSANLFTLPSDMFPRAAVGSIVGIGGTAGAVGGMLIAKLTGWILETTGSYVPVFLIAATTYLVALAVVHLLAPKMTPVSVT
jgi:MFS transporter, ACS family, aldohexuronate transporter